MSCPSRSSGRFEADPQVVLGPTGAYGMLELAVANGVKPVVLTTHSDCAAERAATPPCSFFNDGRFEGAWTLAPGRYALKLVRLPSVSAEQALVWGEPLRVELRAGETTLARLE